MGNMETRERARHGHFISTEISNLEPPRLTRPRKRFVLASCLLTACSVTPRGALAAAERPQRLYPAAEVDGCESLERPPRGDAARSGPGAVRSIVRSSRGSCGAGRM